MDEHENAAVEAAIAQTVGGSQVESATDLPGSRQSSTQVVVARDTKPTKGKRGGKRTTSWKPGQSGNPKGGRPPAKNTMRAILARILSETVALNTGQTLTKGELASLAMVNAAIKGNVAAYALIADRVDGTVAQQMQLNLEGRISADDDRRQTLRDQMSAAIARAVNDPERLARLLDLKREYMAIQTELAGLLNSPEDVDNADRDDQ